MVGCLVSPPWLFSDPEDGGGDIPVPGVNGLAIVVGVGRGLEYYITSLSLFATWLMRQIISTIDDH